MATATQKKSAKTSRRALAGKELEELIKALEAFRSALIQDRPIPTPRNWWQLQAGRFKDDPTFADFVAEVQAARKREG